MLTFSRFNSNSFFFKNIFSTLHVASLEMDVYHFLNRNFVTTKFI